MSIQANHRKLGMIAAAVIFLSDQIMKYIVVYPLALQSRQTIELLPFFELHFVRNFGVSMGFFRADSDAMRWVLVGLTAVIAGFVAVWLWRETASGEVLVLGVPTGGALRKFLHGARLCCVVDFCEFSICAWPPFFIFNLYAADMHIICFFF